MSENEQNLPKIDLIFLLRICMRYARRFWMIGVVLVLLGAFIAGIFGYWTYTPEYEASVSFTVKVSNPLYANINLYNNAHAAQLNATFPYVLRSSILRQRVTEYLGTSGIPTVNTSVLENSNIFTMSVRHSDPEWAYQVIQAMITCYPQVADYVVGGTELIMLDESGVPDRPVKELNVKENAILGGAAGLLIWLGLMLVMTISRRTIHNEDELKKTLNLECLGKVPATKVVGKGSGFPLIHMDNGKFGFHEAIQLLQMHVQKKMNASGSKVLMVSGATPGEGKTTVAVNLAVAFARRGCRTLLIDCDMYNPSALRALGVENTPTVKDFMNGQANAGQLMVKSDVRHLYCLQTGVDFKDNTVKSKFEILLQVCRDRFDYVILDTPPCSLMVDSAELSDFAECGLMVIRQDYASRDRILEGVRMLTDNGLPILGCALNGVSGNLASSGYSYGYGYGYGYNYGYGYGSSKHGES